MHKGGLLRKQSLIIAPSQTEMKAMSKSLQELGGKIRLICAESFKANQIHKLQNPRIKEFLEKVPTKELLDNVQRIMLSTRDTQN